MATLGPLTPGAYPAAPVDGGVERFNSSGEAWATIRDATLGTAWFASDTTAYIALQSHTTTNLWTWIARLILGFDCSSLPTGFVISAATLDLYCTALTNTWGSTQTIHVAGASPVGSSGDFDHTGADYASVSRTSFASFLSTAVSANSHLQISLNSTGLAAITKATVFFSVQSASDITNTPPTWSSNKSLFYTIAAADHATSSQRPTLTITYTTGGGVTFRRSFDGVRMTRVG